MNIMVGFGVMGPAKTKFTIYYYILNEVNNNNNLFFSTYRWKQYIFIYNFSGGICLIQFCNVDFKFSAEAAA